MRQRIDIHRPEDVRAILGGTKRVMRSLINPQPTQADGTEHIALPGDWIFPINSWSPLVVTDPRRSAPLLARAPWHEGDLLLMREPWSLIDERGLPEGARPRRTPAYRASWNPDVPGPSWRPARTCPDWAIRIDLRALRVEVGRIQDPGPWTQGPPTPTGTEDNSRETRAWHANAWVWVLHFEVARAPGRPSDSTGE